MKVTYLIIILISVFFLFLTESKTPNNFPKMIANDTVKAQIEVSILSNGSERYAKIFDKVRFKEKFQILIKADQKYNLWVLNFSANTTHILADTLVKSNSINIFPADNKYYEFDGEQPKEEIVVFLSRDDKPKHILSKLKNEDLIKYIHKLSIQSKCDISEIGEPLVNINGNLREVSDIDFKATKYYGINYLIKEYKFDVKK